MDIINYFKIDENTATSGQPQEKDFTAIADSGYAAVINLALPSAENAIANEGSLVASNGMNYFHIPVIWEAPTSEQFSLFLNIMNFYSGRKIWVHCALNMRVSCFMYLYRSLITGVDKNVAQESLLKVWEPNSIWSEFVRQIEKNYQ